MDARERLAVIAVGTILDDRYRLDRPLARGGFATVYLATHLRLGHQLAIKIFDHALLANVGERDFLARFAQEAAQVARLSHPNILSVNGFGEAEGTAYMVRSGNVLAGEGAEVRSSSPTLRSMSLC